MSKREMKEVRTDLMCLHDEYLKRGEIKPAQTILRLAIGKTVVFDGKHPETCGGSRVRLVMNLAADAVPEIAHTRDAETEIETWKIDAAELLNPYALDPYFEEGAPC